MKFDPKTEEEIKASSPLIPAGTYDFEVVDAQDKISKSSGNPMIEISLNVYYENGKEKLIFDYLLPAFAFKLRHFAEHTGLIERYNSGELSAADCLGKMGKAVIAIRQGQQKPDGGYHKDQNTVKDYIKCDAPQKLQSQNTIMADDLPF